MIKKAYVKEGRDFFTYKSNKDFIRLQAWLVKNNAGWDWELNLFSKGDFESVKAQEVVKLNCEGDNYEIHPNYTVIKEDGGFKVYEPYWFNYEFEVR